MTYVKAAVAAATGALAMWVTAGLWHEVVVSHFSVAPTAPHQGVGIILAAYLLLAVIMTFFLRHARTASNPLLHGIIVGAVIGVLWVFPHDLALAAAHGQPLWPVVTNALWHVIEQGLGGLIIMTTMRALERRPGQAA